VRSGNPIPYLSRITSASISARRMTGSSSLGFDDSGLSGPTADE